LPSIIASAVLGAAAAITGAVVTAPPAPADTGAACGGTFTVAWQSDFGKGSGHKAGLNFGDCFAYALAKSTGEELLFKGDDFGHTDITPALAAAPDGDPG
jgi:hypothetical protein